jgi:hypothetical protein
MMHLFLFDVDSVLVEAHGYFRALQDTVSHFSRRMGVGDHPPTREQVLTFEANGLGCEWDSGAMCIAALLIERVRAEPSRPLPTGWPDTLSALGARPHPIPHPDYGTLARRIGARRDGQTPIARVIRAALWEDVEETLNGQEATLSALLDTLLGYTHDFYRAPMTRYFQHLVIGSQGVAETYGIDPDLDSAAYIHKYDRPLLDVPTRARLQKATLRERIRVAVYTGRPSLPPVEVARDRAGHPTAGYPPEAEMARSLVGLEGHPLIGMGKVGWLAERVGEDVERMIKPSPVQALAAIGAARSGRERDALEAAWALHRGGELLQPLADMGPVTVHVFEDEMGGLQGIETGIALLQAAGVDAAWRAYGIAPGGSPKAAALAARGVPIFSSVNEAITAALDRI